MQIFKKPSPEMVQPLPTRCAILRKAVYDAMEANGVTGLNAAAVLDDIAKGERMRVAATAPLPSAAPRITSGNLAPSTVDRLRDLIAGR